MRKRKSLYLLAVTFLALFFLFISAREKKESEAAESFPRTSICVDAPVYKEGELLVQMRPGVSAYAVRRAHSLVGVSEVKDLGGGIQLVKLPPGMSVFEGIRLYNTTGDVLCVGPNSTRVVKQQWPNDFYFTVDALWGLHNGGVFGTEDADIDAPEAWGVSTGDSNIVIAVVDTGIDYTHPDLVDNIWVNTGEVPGDGVDNDGNGYVDDRYGINAVTWDGLPDSSVGDPMDDYDDGLLKGHGTHVAGTIGARGNNSIGVVGVNWNVKLMACKFIDKATGYGTVEDEAECLKYIADMADAGVNIVAVNASYAGYLSDDILERPLINSLVNRGILFVAAASNDSVDNDGLFAYPASYDLRNIISVAATDVYDSLTFFSNFGKSTVHLGAPGENIVSTLWAEPGDGLYGPLPYGASGTSMGTPHVSGTVGLVYAALGYLPVNDWYRVRNRILSQGDLNASLVGNTITGRRLNAQYALSTGPDCSNPDSPSEITARITPATSEYVGWLGGGG